MIYRSNARLLQMHKRDASKKALMTGTRLLNYATKHNQQAPQLKFELRPLILFSSLNFFLLSLFLSSLFSFFFDFKFMATTKQEHLSKHDETKCARKPIKRAACRAQENLLFSMGKFLLTCCRKAVAKLNKVTEITTEDLETNRT